MLEGLTPPPKKIECRVVVIAQELDKKDAEIFLGAVMDTNWTILGLSTELKKRGITIGEKPITAHRKGVCACLRT